jgi:cob(I)alamin adenosyltransferase
VGGALVAKSDLRLESYGSVDELNSSLGVFLATMGPGLSTLWQSAFLQIQNELFNIGSLLACEDKKMQQSLPPLPADAIQRLEQQIDEMTNALPVLQNFILPGGHLGAAQLHMARTICRRAERHTAKLFEQYPETEPALVYLNRLSDFLFTAARWVNQQHQQPDIAWKK